MRTRRFLALMLAVLMAVSAMTMYTQAEEAAKYAPEVGDGYISFDYAQVTGGVVNRQTNANWEKVTFEGKSAVKVVPTPETAQANTLTMDCWSLAGYEAKVEVPKYKYVGVTYYYDTDEPNFDGQMVFNMLTGSTKALKASASVKSETPIVTKQWAEAIFSFSGKYVINPDSDKPYINQVHFSPYGSGTLSTLTSDDVMYIAKYTFYEKNPDPNAVQTVEFRKGNPDAVGTAPASITTKEGQTFTLPECTFTLGYGKFKGWKYSIDNKLYNVGDTFTAIDADVSFEAVWDETKELSDYIAIDFRDYQNGVVDHKDSTLEYEATEFDGKPVVKIVPNPHAELTKRLALDGWSYSGAGIDLGHYQWFVISYRYESTNPIHAKMRINIMKNGNVITKAFGNDSTEEISAGGWNFALFDMTGVNAVLDPANSHVMRQMHIYPFGQNTELTSLTEGDIIYINQLMFFKEKPNLEVHTGYMTGYTDATFKPNKTMTRAEACTVVARLLDTEENIAKNTTTSFTDVAVSKWYTKYISFCEAKGLLKSYSGTFAPEQNITRAEFAELVYNMGLAKENPANKKTFTDVTAAHPKYAAIMAAASAGLIDGYADGTFLPDRTITRAQVVTIVNRARGRNMTVDTLSGEFNMVFLDVDETHWAYANIAEATVPHVTMDGKWVYAMLNPVEMLSKNMVMNDFTEGNAKLAEVDKLADERKAKILNSESDYSTITGTKYYISNNGNDDADGKSPETAWATLGKLAKTALKKGDGVLFERGGLWRGQISAKAGVTYSAYGTGAKPTIYGSPFNGTGAENWELFHEDAATGKKIWTLKNPERITTDIGAITFDHQYYAYKEVPNYRDGKFYVRGTNDEFNVLVHLDRDFEYFHEAKSVMGTTAPDATRSSGPLYLRCDKGNPGELYKTIEFNTKGNIIGIAGHDVTIDNLCIMYGGNHGIGSGTTKNLTVKNCVLGWIGGSIQSYNFRNATDGRVTRFGNGVEIYGGCDGYLVENNYIYQNYDAGVTHQFGNGTEDISMYNITYRGNLIEDCVYNIEYFLGAADAGNPKRDGKNVLIEDNILRTAGYGFGSTRPDGNNQAHIKGWSSRNEFENYVIKNNIFDRSMWNMFHICAQYKAWLPKLENNTYIQGFGNGLAMWGIGTGKQFKYDLLTSYNLAVELEETGADFYFVEEIPYYDFSTAVANARTY